MAYNFQSLSVLIADDDPIVREITYKILQKWDFKSVDGAENGQEAFELFKKNNHDIVITDCLMQPVDGLELIKLIRNPESGSPNRFVPIIVTTGYTAPDFVNTLRDEGVTELMVKPFAIDDLIQRIVYIMNKPRNFVETPDFFGPDRRRRASNNFDGQNRRKAEDGND